MFCYVYFRVRVRSLGRNTDIGLLAQEIVNKCSLIPPQKLAEVEQQLYYLQNRKETSLNSLRCKAIRLSVGYWNQPDVM